MNFKILTLFPEAFPGPFNQSIMGKALKKKLFTIKTFDIREFSTSKSKTVDDKPYGGGGGMVIKPDVLQRAFNFAKKDLGKKFLQIIDGLFKRIPLLGTFWSAIKQMSQSFKESGGNSKSVVLVEYPRKGVWAVGFATKKNTGEIAEKTQKNLLNVFVPTTPNPTSGFLLMFPIDEVIYLNMTFEEASKFIVSAGTTTTTKD